MNVERRMMDENSINEPDTRTVAIAFALVFGAGMATAIGASVVLFLPQRRSFPTTTTTTTTTTTPSPATSTSVSSSTSPPTTTAAAAAAAAVPQPSSSAWTLHNTILNRYVLASSLGMSAGVMIYVSLIEIFQKSRIAFIDAGYAENMAYVYATSCFFAGVTIMMVLNALVTHFLHNHHSSPESTRSNQPSPTPPHHQYPTQPRRTSDDDDNDDVVDTATGYPSSSTTIAPIRTPLTATSSNTDSMIDSGHVVPLSSTNQHYQLAPSDLLNIGGSSSDDPVRDLEILQQMVEIIVAEQQQESIRHVRHRRPKPSSSSSPPRNTTTIMPLSNGKVDDNDDNITVNKQQQHQEEEHAETQTELTPLDDITSRTTNNHINNVDAVKDEGVEKCRNGNSDNNNNEGSHHHQHRQNYPITNESQVEDTQEDSPNHNHWNDVTTTTTTTSSSPHERQLLLQMSMNTAIAIGLHNFPEGLATFVATLNDPSVGFVLAIAIAIHNIPEGLCVALPVYYATGSRRKAFGWAIMSGLSEPLAAIFGYILLANAVTSTTYGILFGIIAGMMVMISTRELLPTAHRYDPTDRVVTYSFIFGMAVLALSLVLFVL